MKINVTKAYLDMARSVIDTSIHGDQEKTNGEDALFSLMSCTYVFSFMAITSFSSLQLHNLWKKEASLLRVKYSYCEGFEELMAGPLKQTKSALRELSLQLKISPLHTARPSVWRELNELLKNYRDYFVHPNPEKFQQHVVSTGNLEWGFPTRVASEIISYFYEATGNPVCSWVKETGLRSRGFEAQSI